jgi:hypothetical protein
MAHQKDNHGQTHVHAHAASHEAEHLRAQGEAGQGLLEATLYAKLRDPNASTKLRSPMLLALSGTLGAACVEHNNKFYECKAHTNNPEKCLNEGAMVTRCADNVYAAVACQGSSGAALLAKPLVVSRATGTSCLASPHVQSRSLICSAVQVATGT